MQIRINTLFRPALFLLLIFSQSLTAFGQEAEGVRIEGTILDVDTSEPLVGAHVFLASRLQGTTTDFNGRFVIENVLPGSYKVVASIIGYESRSVVLDVTPDQVPGDIAILLKAAVYELDGLVVEDTQPKEWKKQLARFEELFLGTSTNAKESLIVNNYVLSFKEEEDFFEAFASEALQIENNNLGYKLTFVLDQFKYDIQQGLKFTLGTWRFVEMESKDRREVHKWEKQRELTFKGSLQHLLWAMVHLRTDQEGFDLLRDKSNQALSPEQFLTKYHPLDERTILRRTKKPYEYKMAFRDYIRVYYERKGDRAKLFEKRKSPPAEQLSYMKMNRVGEITIHESGYLYTPMGVSSSVTVFGHLASRGVADLLPQEYSLLRDEL